MNKAPVTESDYTRLYSLAEAVSHGVKAKMAEALSTRLRDALVCREEELPESFVRMDSIVSLTEEGSGEKFIYRLVFPAEANISEGRISILSPCGAALLGRRQGEVFSYESPGGVVSLYVDKILHEQDWSYSFV